MTLTSGLIVWGACSLVVLLVLAFDVIVISQISALPPKLTRGWRITLVCLGPFSLLAGVLLLFPPTRYLLYAAHAVLIKK